MGESIEPTEEKQADTGADEPDTPQAGAASSKHSVKIVSSGNVNIRMGNDIKYNLITTVAPGTILPYVATAENCWHAVEVGARVGWVYGGLSIVI